MSSFKQKPAKWMWALAAGVIAAGLLLALPFAPALLRERLSGGLVGGGIFVLALLFFQRERYQELPPEERRELDAEDGDERVQMIRRRAAWRCSQAEDVALLAAALLYAVFYDPVLAHNIPFWLYMARRLAAEALCWYFQRKY